MNIFKSLTLTWWQVGMFKISILSLGVVAGIVWAGTLFSWIPFFLFVSLVFGGYIVIVWMRQR